METIVRDPNLTKNPPLRLGEKKQYTVKGDVCYDRNDRDPQFDPKLKQHFSKAQATSLVEFPNIQPSIFHFSTNQADKAVAFIFNYGENPTSNKLPYALLDRLFVFDAGTVIRPYDFETRKEAEEYYARKVKKEKQLFADVGAFKAILNPSDVNSDYEYAGRYHSDHYNEVLARLRWDTDGSSKIAIANDNFEARCLAQAYAASLLQRLTFLAEKKGERLDPNYEVPICFYAPSKEHNMQPYSIFRQLKDITRAKEMYNDDAEKRIAYKANNYEFLLLLDDIPNVLKSKAFQTPLLFRIIETGYGHIADLLLEKNNDPFLFEDLVKENVRKGYDFNKLYSEATRKGKLNWVQTLLQNKAPLSSESELLILACKKSQFDIIRALAEAKVDIPMNKSYSINEKKIYPLIESIKTGDTDLVKKLLENHADPNVGKIHSIIPYTYPPAYVETIVNLSSKYTYPGTALWVAMRDKHYDIVTLLLKHGYIKNDHTMIAPSQWVYSWLGYPEKEKCPPTLRLRVEYLIRVSDKISEGQSKGIQLTDCGIAFLLNDPVCLELLKETENSASEVTQTVEKELTPEALLSFFKTDKPVKSLLEICTTECLLEVYLNKLKPHFSKLVLNTLMTRELSLGQLITVAVQGNFIQFLKDTTINSNFSPKEMQQIKLALQNQSGFTYLLEEKGMRLQNQGFFNRKVDNETMSKRLDVSEELSETSLCKG